MTNDARKQNCADIAFNYSRAHTMLTMHERDALMLLPPALCSLN